jgi:hypothetical protein
MGDAHSLVVDRAAPAENFLDMSRLFGDTNFALPLPGDSRPGTRPREEILTYAHRHILGGDRSTQAQLAPLPSFDARYRSPTSR